MVNPALVLGAIPLASVVSALYIPHDVASDDPSVARNSEPNSGSKDAAAWKSGEIKPESRKPCHHSVKSKKRKGWNADKSSWERPAAIIDSNAVISNAAPEDIIPDSYIVVMKEDAPKDALVGSLQALYDASAAEVETMLMAGASHPLLGIANGFEIKKVYDMAIDETKAFRGYAGKFLPQVAELIAQHPDVAFVERDSKVHTMKPKQEDQAPWGLARVSHRKPLRLGTYNKYIYSGEGGEGVTSYIVDTGIYIDHEDFEGRAIWGKTMPWGDSDTDAHGHGSHCAGTIGGKKFGVAKKAKLVAVKVLGSDGSGTMSDVIGGVEYVVESHREEKKEKGDKLKGSTANMSLGGGKSPSLDIAVNAATKAGVHFAVAAGNENADACQSSPAGAEGPVTVGATKVNDERAYFSNYGKCVDIFAPGVDILSVGTFSPSSTAVMSGTSMASPHIAGLLTYFVSLQPSSDSEYATRGALTPEELKKHLVAFGTKDILTDIDSESPNILAYNGGGKDISSFWDLSYDQNESEDEDEGEDTEHSSFAKGFTHKLEEIAESVEEMFEDAQEAMEHLF